MPVFVTISNKILFCFRSDITMAETSSSNFHSTVLTSDADNSSRLEKCFFCDANFSRQDQDNQKNRIAMYKIPILSPKVGKSKRTQSHETVIGHSQLKYCMTDPNNEEKTLDIVFKKIACEVQNQVAIINKWRLAAFHQLISSPHYPYLSWSSDGEHIIVQHPHHALTNQDKKTIVEVHLRKLFQILDPAKEVKDVNCWLNPILVRRTKTPSSNFVIWTIKHPQLFQRDLALDQLSVTAEKKARSWDDSEPPSKKTKSSDEFGNSNSETESETASS